MPAAAGVTEFVEEYADSMTRFLFKAKDWNGKMIKGALDLGSKAEVLTSIKDSGLVPISIEKEQVGLLSAFFKSVFGKASFKDVVNFTRQLSTMMTAGLPLTDALSLLKNQTEGTGIMYDILDYALATVRGGQPLGKALEKYSDVFGEAYIASIDAGEQGGVLIEVLQKLADNLENENEFRGKVKGAMIYPVIVVIGMGIVAFVMMVFVIPKLLALYKDFGTSAKMPQATLILMAVSNFAAKFWFLLPLLVFGVYSIMKAGAQNDNFRLKRDSLILKIPIVGNLIEKTVMANTIRTLAMLLGAGIPLVDCLKIVSRVAGNEVYFQAFVKIGEKVQKGFSIASCFEDTEVFPPIVNQMVSTGEATGKLDEVLNKVSEYFAMEAEQSVKALTAAVEPAIMIVLGFGVGFLVIAVIMPIYNLTSSL